MRNLKFILVGLIYASTYSIVGICNLFLKFKLKLIINVRYFVFLSTLLKIQCAAITEEEVTRLLELNFAFDVLHKNYDNQINRAWNTQKHNMRVVNAQFLSRYGFTVQEVKDRENEILLAIEQRAIEISMKNKIYSLKKMKKKEEGWRVNECFFHFIQYM
jgi:hypothetical protein